MTTWWRLTLELEQAIQQRLREFTADLWKEDAITIDVVRAARKVLNGASIDSDDAKAQIVAQIFKADGRLEERFGDLALLVRVTYRDGQTIEGAAFYEAKRRDWSSNKLPAAKRGQLARMHRKLWNGRLLVFDPNRVVTRLTEIVYAPWWDEYRYPVSAHVAPVTQAFSIPLGPVLQQSKFDTSLYKFGTPFACQLVLRNLQGLDLDDDKQTMDIARGYGKKKGVPDSVVVTRDSVVVPRVVLAVAVREGSGEPELPQVDQQLLRPLQGD